MNTTNNKAELTKNIYLKNICHFIYIKKCIILYLTPIVVHRVSNCLYN